MPEPEEKIVIAQAQHNPEAFATLYERYLDRIYAYIYRRVGDVSVAQDIT